VEEIGVPKDDSAKENLISISVAIAIIVVTNRHREVKLKRQQASKAYIVSRNFTFHMAYKVD
jgi:hypothetical protein